ncbi:hypothetical protein ACLB0R_01130 [Sphingomonas sp. GlSt437]|uniref:hypothetical protein n=1 Tax=Sphingomonas sp. GlSt437 TaxID=3389970 RepID=UPI003A86D52C
MATVQRDNFDIEEQRVRILRSIEEAEKFTAEQKKLMAEQAKLRKDTGLAPWAIVVQSLIAGAALMGAALALLKYLAG